MKQSNLLASSSYTDDEIIVSEILLELPTLMSLSEYLKNFNWGSKRKRSDLPEAPPLCPAPSSPSPRTHDEIEVVRPPITVEDDKRTTASPDTPLGYSPSESEQRTKKNSKIRSREKEDYMMNIIEDLTKNRDVLIGEVENVMKHYNKLLAYNSELKAMKQKMLKTYQIKEDPRLEITGGMNLRTELTQHYGTTMVAHQQPWIADPTAQNFRFSLGPSTSQMHSSNNNGPGPSNHVGPRGIDLNVSAEEVFPMVRSQPFDLERVAANERARSSEARRVRRIKIKSTRGACATKLPRTKE